MRAKLLQQLHRDAIRRERNDISTPIFVGSEDVKRIVDQIERSLLDPSGGTDDAERVEAIRDDQGGEIRE
jgi:hypothetical protein